LKEEKRECKTLGGELNKRKRRHLKITSCGTQQVKIWVNGVKKNFQKGVLCRPLNGETQRFRRGGGKGGELRGEKHLMCFVKMLNAGRFEGWGLILGVRADWAVD